MLIFIVYIGICFHLIKDSDSNNNVGSRHEISNSVVCATSKSSNQPAQSAQSHC